MAVFSFELAAEKRTDTGKGASRRLRRAGKVPAILYGGGQDPMPIMLDMHRVLHELENEAFYSHLLKLSIDGEVHQVILKDLQRHPFKPFVYHLDFQRVQDEDVIHQRVPLHIVGEDQAPGVRQYGGLVMHEMTDVEVVCKAKDLPEFIEVDVSNLGPNESLHLSDLKVPEGVRLAELLKGPEHDVAVVTIQARQAAAEEEGEEGAASE
ncbi:MAG: 50S ribosomal protein L25/general stress protein Ctc [Gammaproteobacteria bacterium]|nr:MAG: 50S ribosomal protein L25/general stress protein Ctc [Gammaproteobacteria bacterium]